jgi:hypothetical protein
MQRQNKLSSTKSVGSRVYLQMLAKTNQKKNLAKDRHASLLLRSINEEENKNMTLKPGVCQYYIFRNR